MRGTAKLSGNGSSGSRGCSPEAKERRRQSGENSDQSPPQPKRNRTDGKDPSATEAAGTERQQELEEKRN
jgi:hypothetical protein